MTVPEDVAVGTEVLRVLATSVDIGPNAEITYNIRLGNELGKFTIDRNLGEQRSSYVARYLSSKINPTNTYPVCAVLRLCSRLHFCD